MKNQRLAFGSVVTAALLLPACGGGGAGAGEGGGSSGPMDLVQVHNGFGQLLPHTVLKLDANGNPTPTVVPIRTNNDLLNNVTTTNLVRSVPLFPLEAQLPSSSPGNHFVYAEFNRPIDIDTVLSSSPGAQANSGLLGTVTLVSIDPTTGSASPVPARVFINGQTYAGAPTGSPPVLPLQSWVTLGGSGHPVAIDADPVEPGDQLPGTGFPGTQFGGFNGDAKLVSPNTIVFVADADGDLATHETFPAGRQLKLRVSTAVKSTAGNYLIRQALACTTVGPDTFRPEVATTPPPLNLPLISPGNGDLGVDPLTDVRIEFTEPVQPTSIGSLPNGSQLVVSSSVRVQFGPASSVVTVPFTVMPVSVFDLSTYELTPAFNFPGQGPAAQPCGAFNEVTVSVNPTLINDLVGLTNQLAASTSFQTGEGPGLVNVPVTPDAIYIGRAGAVPGLSVIDLNGFGGSTGNWEYDILNPIVEGASNYPNNPNVKLQGSLLFPPLVPGQCTVNGGSAGVFTLSTDSSLENKVVRAPLITSVNDMMLGHALDGTFNNGPAPFGCQSGGGNLCAFDGKKLIVPLINGNTMNPNTGATQPNQSIQPGAENLMGWAPHPNPPPLVFPPLCISPLIGGQEPTSVVSALFPPAGQGLTNLLVSGSYFGDPANGVPPSGLLTPEDNSYFEGPSPPQATINACSTYMMRQQVGHYLYVIDRARREIVVFNSNRMTVIDRIPTQDPTTLAMSPNLNLLAVTNQLADLVSFIDIDPNSGNFHQVVQETIVGNRPRGIAWDPGNEDILVCNEGEDTMSILSAASLTVRRVVSSQLSDPFDVAITPRQQGFGFFRNVYFAYILNRNGSVAMFESGPNQVNGWGYDDVIGIAPATFRNPKAIQPDHIDLRSAVWIAHEGPIDAQTGAPGNFGIGAVSKLVIVSGVQGQVPLVNQAFPQFRDMALGVQVSIGTPGISGVPIDIAFDNLRNLAGLAGLVTPFSVGSPVSINSKQLVRGVPLAGGVQNTNEPRYMFVAVPNPNSGTGVVDVVRIDQGFTRIDTNAFHAGIQSIPVTNCQVVMDYYRQ